MDSDNVTTPFGRRGVSVGLLARQFASRNIDSSRSIDKWKLFRATCEARPLLGISDRSLAVLNALISFYPKAELSEENGLVVFPSNQQLSLRAHGMAEQTLRRHLAALVEAGLILRKDSPNGKRYARKDRSGGISDAYGFSLAPLIVRADEIQAMADQVMEERLRLQRLREKISLCRRDIIQFNEIALMDGIDGTWDHYEARYHTLTSSLNRKRKAPHLALILEELTTLRAEMAKILENHIKSQNMSANAYQNERLIQNSESESILEMPTVARSGKPLAMEQKERAESQEKVEEKLTPVKNDSQTVPEGCDLQTVLQACPEITFYGPNGSVSNWHDLKQAAGVVKTMLSISQSAYDEAEKIIGIRNTATIIACILERADAITSAGGYLRSLTRKTNSRQFSIKPMLLALLRSRIAEKRVPDLQAIY